MDDEDDYVSPPRNIVQTLECIDPAELAALRAKVEQLRIALTNLVAAVGAMRVPQTTEDVFLQLHVTLGPVFEAARDALNK